MKFSINIFISLFILIFISACGGGGSSSPPPAPPPTITSFSASSTTITTGNSVDLTAVFIADGTASIDNNVGTVTSDTSVTVSPSTNTTYTLTVTKSDGSSETSALTITVVGLNSLSILNESFDQVFQENQFDYTASVGFLAKSTQINATSADASASITVNGVAISTDGLSQLIDLTEGADTLLTIVVTQNTLSKTYTATISRALATTFAEQAFIQASNSGTGDEFGYSVALSGDTLAVGAHFEASSTSGIDSSPDDSAASAGAVYVFVRSGTSWTQQAYIKASNSQTGDEFGYSVALSGDTLVVGAIGEDSNTQGMNTIPDELAASSGAVYVFIRNGSSWSEQTYIKASNTQGSDEFGFSVSLSGDTLAVGAHQEDSATTGVNTTPDEAASNSGAVYVFTRSDTSWTQQAYIKASNTGGSDSFGYSLTLSGDTLAVGAYREDSSTLGINTTPFDNKQSDDYGAVYVFVRNNANWVEQAYIKASETNKLDYFGFSVALSGDTLAVGAYLEDSETTGIDSIPNDTTAGANSGAVYVFTRSNNIWIQQAYIKASNTGKTDLFGKSITLSGDILAVGADQEDSETTGINSIPNDTAAGANSGAVYVFTRSNNTWSQQAYIKASTTVTKVNFGQSVALASDTLAVGVPLENTSAGASYIFE